MLFGAFAHSIGYETRIGLVGDRRLMFFDLRMPNVAFLRSRLIGVNVRGEWHYADPGSKFLPYGMLNWYDENAPVLLVGEKQFSWETTSFTPYERSEAKRTGKFRLTEDGTLEGRVTIEYTGQFALEYRKNNADQNAAKLEEDFVAEIKPVLTTAEISEVRIENLNDESKPLVKRYSVRVLNYAQKTGTRLFLQPGYFKYGAPAVFSGSTRKYDIFFHYPWSENDSVDIALPKDFDLDNADAPGLITDKANVGGLNIDIKVNKATNTLMFRRHFHFGGGGNTLFKADAYSQVKTMFDTFQKADGHTITLKQK